MIGRCKQKGITIIEFTIVASTILLVIFAILELGFFVFNNQLLNDISRRTARIASVCPVSDTENIIQLALSERKPPNFSSGNLLIEYLDINGVKIVNASNDISNIKFVKASVVSYDYGFSGILSFIGGHGDGIITLPSYTTILPAESLGIYNATFTHTFTCQ